MPTRPQGRAKRQLDLRSVAVPPRLPTMQQIKNSPMRHAIRQNVRVVTCCEPYVSLLC